MADLIINGNTYKGIEYIKILQENGEVAEFVSGNIISQFVPKGFETKARLQQKTKVQSDLSLETKAKLQQKTKVQSDLSLETTALTNKVVCTRQSLPLFTTTALGEKPN